jgi:hypothetical protein
LIDYLYKGSKISFNISIGDEDKVIENLGAGSMEMPINLDESTILGDSSRINSTNPDLCSDDSIENIGTVYKNLID